MEDNQKQKSATKDRESFNNKNCPKKDKDGNCLVPGVHSDSDPIGGG